MSFHEGVITKYRAINNLYHVTYTQGDKGQFTYDKIGKYRKVKQIYTKQKKNKPVLPGRKRQFRDSANSIFFIPTKACPNPVKLDHFHKHQAHLLHQQHQKYFQLRHSALAEVVCDNDLKKMASYKEIVNHRKDIINKCWTQGGENKFDRCFQGFSPNIIDDLNVLEWTTKQ